MYSSQPKKTLWLILFNINSSIFQKIALYTSIKHHSQNNPSFLKSLWRRQPRLSQRSLQLGDARFQPLRGAQLGVARDR